MTMPTKLDRSILETVAFFSYFRYPLTMFEIWKWLMTSEVSYTLEAVMRRMEESEFLTQKLDSENGFYGLSNQRSGDVVKQVRSRHERFINAVYKYRKLKKVLAYVERVPGVKGVALCNSLAIHHTKPESDIDLFIVTTPGRIWRTRLFTVLPFVLFKQRPGEVKEDPVDISFFVTDHALNISNLKLSEHDPYLAWWVRALVPVRGREEIFQLFVRHNAWAKVILPNSLMPKRAYSARKKRNWQFPRLPISEAFAEKLQRRKFPEDIAEADEDGTDVVINEQVLKFHKNDRREEVKKYMKTVLDDLIPEQYESHR